MKELQDLTNLFELGTLSVYLSIVAPKSFINNLNKSETMHDMQLFWTEMILVGHSK